MSFMTIPVYGKTFYFLFFFHLKTPSPKKPAPNNTKVDGSGTTAPVTRNALIVPWLTFHGPEPYICANVPETAGEDMFQAVLHLPESTLAPRDLLKYR